MPLLQAITTMTSLSFAHPAMPLRRRPTTLHPVALAAMLALSPKGELWAHEHGPQGGDEINLPQPGVIKVCSGISPYTISITLTVCLVTLFFPIL